MAPSGAARRQMLRFLVDEAGLPVEQGNGALARRVRGPATIVVRVPDTGLKRSGAADLESFFSDHEKYLAHPSMGEWNVVPTKNAAQGFKVMTLQQVHNYRQSRVNGTLTALPSDELLKIVPTVQDFRALLKMARDDMQHEVNFERKRQQQRVAEE